MDAAERFSPEAAEHLRAEIRENCGGEVFAAGRLGEDGRIDEILVVARGTRSAVPALAPYLERGDIIVHNHPSGSLGPSEADVSIAAEVGQAGIGSYIVDNQVSRVHVVAEPVRRRALVMLNEDEISGVLEEGGKLSGLIPNYEPRKSQVRLARDVTSAFNQGAVLAAEAGTGVGKSFAYLIPAFAWAIRNEERVVVSTATINLQRQLADKDIPVVQRLFRKKTKAVLVKGRGNYLCRTRLREALDEEGLFAGEDHPLKKIAAWAEVTASGDREDLPFWAEDKHWSRAASESESCLGLRCPERESCFLLRARKEAADAQVIVANHHILFSDLAARMNGAGYEQTVVLPAFRILVMDEAHAIEASATSFFSKDFNRFALNKKLARVTRRRADRDFGLLAKLLAIPDLPAKPLAELPRAVADTRRAVDELDARAMLLFGAEAAKGEAAQRQRQERSFRLSEPSPLADDCLIKPIAELERKILRCTELLGDILAEVPEELSQDRAMHEARLSLRGLSEAASLCARFRNFEDEPETVFWLERGRTSLGESFIDYIATPLDITGTMDEAVFTKFHAVICTSATLSVGESFDFWKSRVGLSRFGSGRADCGDSGGAFSSVIYPSPFPFKTNALLAIDASAPPPESPAYRDYINRAVPRLIEASEGHALVLFTSYEAMHSAYEAARPAMEALGLTMLKQGSAERTKLLETFKADVSSVLFATDSFWEGIDAPGETLQLVVICKLPFRVPTDPVQLARSEAVALRGGNAFMEISLPEAVIRLKQGFGRLIRHSMDRGVVVVLDSRLATKRYGPLFVQSLPECRLVNDELAVIIKETKNFLFDW